MELQKPRPQKSREVGESRQESGDMQEEDDVPKNVPEPELSGTNAGAISEPLDLPSSLSADETSDSDKVYDRTRGRGRPKRIHVHASLTESAA